MKEKVTLGIIVSHRGVFPKNLAVDGRKSIIKAMDKLGVDYVVLPGDTGIVSDAESAEICTELFKANQDKIGGIFVSLPDFGEERHIADVIRNSGLNVPVFLHAFSDHMNQMGIANRRDSFCGKISASNALTQYQIPFTLSENFTTSPDSPEFADDVRYFSAVCRVVKAMSRAKIGVVGARVNAFRTVRFSEKLLESSGISVDTIDLSQVQAYADNIDENAAEFKKVKKQLIDYLGEHEQFPPHVDGNLSKLFFVIDNWVRENELDAFSIQCWPTLQETLKIYPCAFMSLLSSNLLPAACETDAMGALAMLALQASSGTPTGLFDWNNNVESDRDSVVLFHCSNCALPLVENYKFSSNSMESKRESSFITIHGNLKEGPYTFCRIHTNDIAGGIEAIAGEGSVQKSAVESFGTVGIFKVPGLPRLLNTLCYHGFEHHVAITQGNFAGVLSESFEKYLGWNYLRY